MIEIARAPTASLLDVVSAILAGPGIALTLACAVVLIWPLASRPAARPLSLLATLGTLAELAARAAGGSLGHLATDARSLGLLARIAVLVAVVAVGSRSARWSDLGAGERRVGELAAAVTLLVTLPVTLPSSVSPTRMAWLLGGAAVVVGGITAVNVGRITAVIGGGIAGAGRLAARRLTTTVIVSLALTTGIGMGMSLVPPRAPSPILEHLTIDGTTVDLILSPGDVGRNEFHLYAWEADLQPAELADLVVTVEAGGERTVQPVLAVTPNHYLSYELDLPDPGPWTLELRAVRGDGSDLSVRLALEQP